MIPGAPAVPDWLVRQPIAHRGLHDRAAGIVENSTTAALAAMSREFAIECDVQLTADLDAVVFHDFELNRLTGECGQVADLPADRLDDVALRGSTDCIPKFSAFLTTIGGRVPLVCEIKSRFDGDLRLADRVADLAAAYPGPLAIKSFDPQVIAHLRSRPWAGPLGIVAEASYDDPDWSGLTPQRKRDLSQFLHFAETRPDFVSYHVGDLPHAIPYLCRTAIGIPIMAWTVRTPEQRQRAATWADQIVFEGFVP